MPEKNVNLSEHKMSWNSRSRLNFAHALNKFTHTHSHWSYNSFLSPSGRSPWPLELLSEVPGSGSSSPSVQWDRTWFRTDFLGWCLPSPDETARWVGPFLLGVQVESRLLRELGHQGQRRTQNTIGWCTTSFGPVSLPTPMQPSC
jgi:hypothetical protein